MCRHILFISETKNVAFGFLWPNSGYFAVVYDPSKEATKQVIDEIGFIPICPNSQLISFFRKHNVLDEIKMNFPVQYKNIGRDFPC